jgi:hypothetical protein
MKLKEEKSRRSPDLLLKNGRLPQMTVHYDRSKIARYGLNRTKMIRIKLALCWKNR